MKKAILIILAFVAVVTILGMLLPESELDINNKSSHLVMAENNLKKKLNDPGSYKRYNYSQRIIGEGKVVNTIDYGAKNKFGGMVRNIAIIETLTEDGKMYNITIY